MFHDNQPLLVEVLLEVIINVFLQPNAYVLAGLTDQSLS